MQPCTYVFDIGPTLKDVILGLPTLIAAAYAAYNAYRNQQLLNKMNGGK